MGRFGNLNLTNPKAKFQEDGKTVEHLNLEVSLSQYSGWKVILAFIIQKFLDPHFYSEEMHNTRQNIRPEMVPQIDKGLNVYLKLQ